MRRQSKFDKFKQALSIASAVLFALAFGIMLAILIIIKCEIGFGLIHFLNK